jgi:chemotaxis response regulator CheB
VLGDLPTSLHDTVSGAIRAHIDLKVVGVAVQPTALLLAAGALRPDVVVLALAGGGLPGLATHLLDQYPRLCVLALEPGARQGLRYALRPCIDRVETSSSAELVRALKSAGQPRDGR